MRLVMLLTIPSAIGLIILAEPIISLIYQHGRFTAEATRQTAAALRFYAIGLAGYAGVKVLAPAFYAINKRNLPMLVSLFSIAVNFGLNWFFTFSTRAGASRARAFHQSWSRSRISCCFTDDATAYGASRNRAMFATLAKLLVAGAVLAVVCFGAQWLFFRIAAGSAHLATSDRSVRHDRGRSGAHFSVRPICFASPKCDDVVSDS